ncbi:MAG: heme biosynthesis HemY N-terminal domain-containing protein [Gammaproteobacteria bacterium]
MKLLAKIFLVLLAAVSLALIARNEPGYILIDYGAWKIETTLTLAVTTLVLGFAALYSLLRIAANAWAVPRRMRAWQQQRQSQRASNSLTHGLIQMEEGRWQAAEEGLIKHANIAAKPLLHYLAAARAAQKQGAHERRDKYLRLAHQSTPGADVAVGLTQAELQLNHHQAEQALATLQHVSMLAPKHTYVAKLLMKLYIELHDWAALLVLLPALRKQKIISQTEADELETRAHASLIAQVPRTQNLQVVTEIWNSVPKRLRTAEPILVNYIQQLRAHGAELQAEAMLREALKSRWSDNLIYLYGLVEGPDPAKQLAYAEACLKHHSKNSMLLLTLGRLCLRNRLWGKGRAYFESSIGMNPCTETYQELGYLLEQMNEPGEALEYYRKGLSTVVNPAVPVASATASNGITEPPKLAGNLPRLPEDESRI